MQWPAPRRGGRWPPGTRALKHKPAVLDEPRDKCRKAFAVVAKNVKFNFLGVPQKCHVQFGFGFGYVHANPALSTITHLHRTFLVCGFVRRTQRSPKLPFGLVEAKTAGSTYLTHGLGRNRVLAQSLVGIIPAGRFNSLILFGRCTCGGRYEVTLCTAAGATAFNG